DRIVVIAGTTASGKSDLALDLAERIGGEIVSADSRQVYRGMDLGTGKVTPEEQARVPHHLLDVAEPRERYTLHDYVRDATAALDGILARGRTPILCGGTGLYINALVDGYALVDVPVNEALRAEIEPLAPEALAERLQRDHPEWATRTDLNNPRRLVRAIEVAEAGVRAADFHKKEPRYDALVFGVTWPRDVLAERIAVRLDRRLEEGMLDEVRGLLASGVTHQRMLELGLEYRSVSEYLHGEWPSLDAMKTELATQIRRYAKRQMTWFRKRPDEEWLDMSALDLDAMEARVRAFSGGGASSE
ncbi:MAG: tRNA (adenosine(37)-N6)-dimethylallyltransferase MiaA, partial [Bacteroidota bacterium]